MKGRLGRYLIVSLGLAAAIWLAGLELFVTHIGALGEPSPAATDAIVVLTGGSERVATGLELLRAGKGKKLFISGVHPGLSLERMLGPQPVAKELRECCIVLGHAAESTSGNAEETLTWMVLENYHSLRLVTANYHMPRSLLLFHAVMPDIEIIPHPVAPDNVKLDEWWLRPGTASLLVTEYDKYLWANIHLWLGNT
jgi:uncharacterized SAM-binding protein YcdF (DUF218 family)